MSTFSALGVGARALQAAQRGLDTTGQNISNVATPGYTRQRLDQVALGGSPVPAMWSRSTPGVGDGVQVRGTERVRDTFLDARALQLRGTQASSARAATTLSGIESAFGEPGDTGLQVRLSSFWNAWHDVANEPTASAPRTQLLEQAGALADTFQRVGSELSSQWSASRTELTATVAEANSTAEAVARLNAAIRSATAAGAASSELADQRDELVRSLGEKLGATSQEMDDGTVTVTVGGGTLVMGSRAHALAATGPTSYPGSPDSVGVTWADSGAGARVTGGTVAGLLTAVNTTIPAYSAALDGIAAQVSAAANAQQAAGYDRTGAAGAPLFSGTTAASIGVALVDGGALAASSAPPPAYDGDNAAAMAGHLSDSAGPDATYRDLVASLGLQTQAAGRETDVQSSLLSRADAARQSVSSVSLDEEMTNLMTYQHAYEAAARFIGVVDSTFDSLFSMLR